MSVEVMTFLRHHGLAEHPFRTTNGEEEREHLPAYFVHVRYFDQLLEPTSLLLFAPRGYGKTSHRLEVGRIITEQVPPALVVNFTAFDRLLTASNTFPTLEDYLHLIREYTLKALASRLHPKSAYAESLQQHPALDNLFFACLMVYAPLLAFEREPPPTYNAALANALCETPMSVREWLQRIVAVARAAGFSGIHFLLDGVDEHDRTRSNADTIIRVLSPLLTAPSILQGTGFAFKFFLPDFIQEPMEHSAHIRLDRLPVYRLQWDDEQLRRMLHLRLLVFSRPSETVAWGSVSAFRDLVATSHIDVDSELIRAAQGSPRRLISLARRIITTHCEQALNGHAAISLQTLKQVLSEATLSNSTPAPPLPQVVRESEPSASSQPLATTPPSIPPLYFDERGNIWLGARNITVDKALPRTLRACMEYLWLHRTTTIRYQALAAHLYAGRVREDPEGAADKRVMELRRLFREQGQGVMLDTYITKQAGTGYLLQNYSDVAPFTP